ncbi:MAG: L-2-hydroxyglutarate oxidase [Verrucomicrobia bacterium]|nr:L-2-hydroxyglutarate oxidase [Verrucomicrobiota bacterium]
MRSDFIVIGGGIVGLAAGLRILEANPGKKLLLLEKESSLGQHQTGHNSGVLHAGLYYKPGSLKAKLAVEGLRQMVVFCQRHGVSHEQCGKIVVATEPDELPRLEKLVERGVANGLKGLRKLSPEQIREIEPYAAGLAAIHVPEEGIVDYAGVVEAMAKEIKALGGEIRNGERVDRLKEAGGIWRVETSSETYETKQVVACAGLHSDRVALRSGMKPTAKIIPFRGEYYMIRKERQFLVRNLIYPVPDPQFPFLGVHFTRMVKGGVEAGPNAVLAMAREGYTWGDINIMDLAESLSFPGLWKFMLKYPSICSYEIWRSINRREFCRSLQKLVPEICEQDLETGSAGVRAQAMSSDGSLVEDFSFVEEPGILHVVNAPSPAATASLAIGEYVARRLDLKSAK